MTYDDLERLKKSVLRKYPIQGNLAFKGIKFELTKKVDTAAVSAVRDKNGKLKVNKLLINPDFFERLTYGQRVFVLAHEMCHIALKHFARSEKKPEKDIEKKYLEYCEIEQDEAKRKAMKMKLTIKYQRIWNVATDACINAFLKKDGLSFPYGVVDPKTGEEMKFIDMKEGMSLRAEKIYDYLVSKDEEDEKKKEEDKSNSGTSGNGGSSNSSSTNNNDKDRKNDENQGNVDIDDVDIDDYQGIDSHDSWRGEDEDNEKEVNESSDEKTKDEEESKEDSNGTDEATDEDDTDIDDEEVFNKEVDSRKSAVNQKPNLHDDFKKIRHGLGLDDLNVPKKPVLSWKRLLVGSLEKEEDVWGYRRANRSSPNARIEERTYDTLPQIEIVLDSSGSISSELLKGFLLQLYPIFDVVYDEKPVIKVGCFSNDFYGFNEIRSKADIAKFNPQGGGGTNYEAAASAFTKDPGHKITKIVFTDGDSGINPTTNTSDVIWVVFGNPIKFKPIGGRIIKVNEDEYKDIISTGSKLLDDKEPVIKRHI